MKIGKSTFFEYFEEPATVTSESFFTNVHRNIYSRYRFSSTTQKLKISDARHNEFSVKIFNEMFNERSITITSFPSCVKKF